MRNFVLAKLGSFYVPVLMMAASGCSTISRFDQYSYTQATSLKVDAVNLMSNATQSYESHLDEVVRIKTSVDKIYEYEKNRPKNLVSEKMWLVLRDSSGHSFGGFLKRWQIEKTLDAAFIKESQQLVSESFDQISQLESGKIKQVTN